MIDRATTDSHPSLADIVERLFGEFETSLDFSVVLATVRHCRRELDVTSGPALPELLERLARQRLDNLLDREHYARRRGD